MKLDEFKTNISLTGVEPFAIITVKSVDKISADTIQIIYKMPNGAIKERLINQNDVNEIEIAVQERPFAFDGDGEKFKLAVEAKRIDLAFLFDPMMAVHTSNVEPLPHQITAVYESMLPKQPLRFVLADDPGAGKTIMAGLYIRELIMRADARKILIVAPGGLVEQWRDELYEKFGLEFQVYSSELVAATPGVNPFEKYDHLIVRLDQMSRSEEEQGKLCKVRWDLVVFDEAHKLSAHFFGTKVERTKRFIFADRMGASTRHLLLMTATPHNGKEEDFQLFLSLLDSDRFYGKFRDGVHKVDTSDLMRRMVKEELVKFDGMPLFPERRAYTVNYKLSDIEVDLYNAITEYVQTEMGKADELDGKRKVSVGFALTSLQRRLASSPEAIYQSLKRRKAKLESRLREEKIAARGGQLSYAETLSSIPEDDDELDANEQEGLEESLIDQATAARTIGELQIEINKLHELEEQARKVVSSGQDRKWDELSRILQNVPETRDKDGRLRKLIIFSEHRDTLNYLQQRISGLVGKPAAVVTIHGGTHRDDRKRIQELFRSDPETRILVATDAAGEGVNLQNANLMVNYDLPWNPNRLEQRFGRIHRIGQQEVCHLWSLVAGETREGDVYQRLLNKIEIESKALQGRVFDILGEVFEEIRLKDLLIEAIRYGDRPDVRDKLCEKVETALNSDRIREILNRNALVQETMGAERLFAVKEEMEKVEARKLQPHFVRTYFMKAFEMLGGSIHQREAGRFEITHVPASILERDRQITGRNRRESAPVLKRYERICFTKDAVRPVGKPGLQFAVLMHPGHPLMLAMSDLILEQNKNLMRQGSVFVDPADDSLIPGIIFLMTHEVISGDEKVISKRLQFVRVGADGTISFAGWAPHLDLEPIAPADLETVKSVLDAPWLKIDLEQHAIMLAVNKLVPEHFAEVSSRRIALVDKTLAAVHERLTKEIVYWTDRWEKLKEDKAAGKDVRLQVDNCGRIIDELEARLESRKKELQAMRHVQSSTPVILGGALVIPAGLMKKLREGQVSTADFSNDSEARKKIEKIGMNVVRQYEESQGCRVFDVSDQKCGWDITSYPPITDGRQPEAKHIEVKARVKGSTTITVTRNEILYALNQAEQFILAIVLVDENDKPDGPYYIKNPFDKEPGWGVASINYDLKELLSKVKGE
ncbi:MAG: helicase-related protein [Candidatus Wallbacteria bacterium]